MASGWTNKGKYKVLGWSFRGETIPTNFYIYLATSAVTPTVDHNTKSEITEVSTGQGYTAGGISIAKNSTDWDVWTEDDSNDRGYIQLKDMVWTASGGTLPASDSARWAVLTDDNATQGSREVYAWWDLSSDRQVSDTQTLTLQNCELRIN